MENQFYFEQDWFFLLLIIPLIIWLFWKYLRHRHTVLTVTTIDRLDKRQTSWPSPPVLMLVLRLLCVLFIIAALVNLKVRGTENYKKTIAETDIVLALDVSKSMLIEDIKPNRLGALKEVLSEFIAGRSNDRIGIVLYAGESIYWCPLTKDYPFLLKKLNEIDENDFLDGTAIGIGLTSAVNALQASKNKNKIIILLTDGENNAGFIDPLTAAVIAKKFKIKVYTIGIGKTGVAPFPITDLNGKKTYVPLEVSIDEDVLKKIASGTGGIYFSATNNKALQSIYTEIDKLEKTKTVVVKEVKYHSEFRIFTLIAMLFLLLEITLKFTIFRTWPQ